MSSKKEARLRRSKKCRAEIKKLQLLRLAVYRTSCHMYAQIVAPDGGVVVCASTLDKEVRELCSYGGNVVAARAVGRIVAARAVVVGVKKVAFDRSGFKYHGRVKALADAAREHGLIF